MPIPFCKNCPLWHPEAVAVDLTAYGRCEVDGKIRWRLSICEIDHKTKRAFEERKKSAPLTSYGKEEEARPVQ